MRSTPTKLNVKNLDKAESLVKGSTSSFLSLSSSVHLFNDYDDTSSHEFRQFYPLRNRCSLTVIFAIIDSKDLT